MALVGGNEDERVHLVHFRNAVGALVFFALLFLPREPWHGGGEYLYMNESDGVLACRV